MQNFSFATLVQRLSPQILTYIYVSSILRENDYFPKMVMTMMMVAMMVTMVMMVLVMVMVMVVMKINWSQFCGSEYQPICRA